MSWLPTNPALAACGTVLLLVPAPQWYGRMVSYRTIEYLEIARRNAGWWVVWRRLLRMPQHWIELGRSVAGTACVLLAVRGLRLDPVLDGKAPPFWLRDETAVGVAALGLMLMLALFRKTTGLLAPVVYVSGVTAVAAPGSVAGLALVLAFTVMAATRQLGVFFAVLAMGLGGVGWLLTKNLIATGAVAGFALIPVAMALLRNRELVLAVRRSRSEIDSA
ncbi:MAG: hypothetical protein HZA93_20615 [Verrucomicrobia bacterium]|nr:hypothetical protein [Verrucomicrobiota bacterium]